MNVHNPISLNAFINHILVNLEKTHSELGILSPKYKYRMKEVHLNIIYYDYSEKPLPNYFSILVKYG